MFTIKNKYTDKHNNNWNNVFSKFTAAEKLIEQGNKLSNSESSELKGLYADCNMDEAHIIQTYCPFVISSAV
jgi:hypothetical protein